MSDAPYSGDGGAWTPPLAACVRPEDFEPAQVNRKAQSPYTGDQILARLDALEEALADHRAAHPDCAWCEREKDDG